MTTSPQFEFHLTFDDIDDADALMRHLETALPGRPVQVDIRGGDTRTVSVTITPPPAGPERHPFRLVHPDFDTASWSDLPAQRPAGAQMGVSADFIEFDGVVVCDDRERVQCCDADMVRFAGPGQSRGWSCFLCGNDVVEVTEDGEHIASAGPAPRADAEDAPNPEAELDPSEWAAVGHTDRVGATAPQERPPWSIGDRDAFSAMPIRSLNTDGWSPVDLLELLVFKLARAVPSFPVPETVVDDVAFADAWAQAWQQFEGMPTKRIIVAALDQLTEPDSYDLDAVAPLVDELVPRFDAAIASRTEPAGDHDGHTIDLGPVDQREPTDAGTDDAAPAADSGEQDHDPDDEPGSENAGGAGDAGIREDPEGTNGALATSPAPPATFTPTATTRAGQVVELLNAYPDTIFRPGHVDDALGLGDPVQAATVLGAAAKQGRIAKIARGQYQALRTNGSSAELRERITAWFAEHDTGSAETIATALTADLDVVKAELRRMHDAGLIRPGGRGWRTLDPDDTAARHKARRRAAVEAM